MKNFLEIVEEIKSIVSTEFNGRKIYDKDVADILGISQMNFATMKKRNKIPFGELLDFCATKSISINWLLYGQSPESLVEATNRFFMVKYFGNVNASAGGGADADEEEAHGIEIPHEFVIMLGGERELKYIEAINVSGDSMEPTFSYNDIVFINRSKTDLQRGGIFTIRTEAGLFIKRIQKRIDGKIDIISDNQVYSTQTLDPSEIEVIGRVVSRFGSVD
ncbi:LexA family transcriptional regulator [Sulfurimonas sp.]|jgi:DNA-binding Xre family transcriptional regulator|uniref:LexA family transcriptional regulator n=1 Tax=Sulfurimonas sp. TaxID=2022749 RepID=UPI002A3704C1|nr:LexA family transcriptional regulator [Sulfurimonas sp.]MDY0124335.1 LexA family transcriptional regulator [Sulfurimonas sp.]